MKATVVIPICYLNNYSREVIKRLANEKRYSNLEFLFSVSNLSVKDEIAPLFKDSKNSYIIDVVGSTSSNRLRSRAKIVQTSFVYYQDCDDWVDYDLINNKLNEITTDDYVLCYNFIWIDLNENGVLNFKKKQLNYPEGLVKRIEYVPTNIYSKLIPTKYIRNIDFEDLPYTQDWNISYSLFLIAPHIFSKTITYFYKNYKMGCSDYKNDSLEKIKYVKTYSKILIKQFKDKGLYKQAEFLKFRYNTVLIPRLARFNKIEKPYFIPLKYYFGFSLRFKISILYRSIKDSIICLKVFLRNQKNKVSIQQEL